MRSKSSTPIPDYFYDAALHVAGIYSITCMVSGKQYIGSSIDVSLRWRCHFKHLRAGTHHCSHMQRSWIKYGHQSFRFDLIENVQPGDLRAREQFHIDSVSPAQRLNASPTAGSLLGFKMNAESLERMRVAHTGFRHSEETKQRARIARAGIAPRPAGWKMSAEGCAKVSAARSGTALSPEHRAKSIATLSRINKLPHSQARRDALAERRRGLTDDQVLDVRMRYLAGESMQSISDSMISGDRKTISRAIRGEGIYGSIGFPVTHNVSRPLSDERKAQIGAFHKGRPKPESMKAKMSAFQKGRPKSETAKERMRQAWVIRKQRAQQ